MKLRIEEKAYNENAYNEKDNYMYIINCIGFQSSDLS